MDERFVLKRLKELSKNNSTDSSSFDVPGFQLVIENVQIKGKVSIGRKVKCVEGAYNVGWMLNDQWEACMRCQRPFGVFKWRHHCRKCGFLVCNSCSSERIQYPQLKYVNPVRACSECYRAHHVRNARRGRNEEDTPEEEPEPLLTRVPSWVQGGQQRLSDVRPPKRISETIRRISENSSSPQDTSKQRLSYHGEDESPPPCSPESAAVDAGDSPVASLSTTAKPADNSQILSVIKDESSFALNLPTPKPASPEDEIPPELSQGDPPRQVPSTTKPQDDHCRDDGDISACTGNKDVVVTTTSSETKQPSVKTASGNGKKSRKRGKRN